jgi:hypothetical protein
MNDKSDSDLRKEAEGWFITPFRISVRSKIFEATHAAKFPSLVGAAYSAPDEA